MNPRQQTAEIIRDELIHSDSVLIPENTLQTFLKTSCTDLSLEASRLARENGWTATRSATGSSSANSPDGSQGGSILCPEYRFIIMGQSDEYFPDIPDEEEAKIQRIAEETGCTRDEVINMLIKNFFKRIDQATDETELTGFARKIMNAMRDRGQS